MAYPSDEFTRGSGAVRRLARRRRRLRTGVVTVLVAAAAAATAFACSVPVFRYALERWSADRYLAIVFHEGELSPEQAGWARDLDQKGAAGDMSANVTLRTVDLSAPTDPALLRWWRPLASTATLPAVVLMSPAGLRIPTPAWHGPLAAGSVRQILDSPARREIAGRLLQGHSAVWVLIESGDARLDTAAARTLETRLRHLEATLTLPELNPADVVGGATAASAEKLKAAFSTLRLSRQDPAERVLIGMLLNTEEDLAGAREPIVFPVFGQGRVLHALVGPGINPDMIDETARFLTGACSCVVKEQNPGSDLLFAIDWARLVSPLIKSNEELPPLSGVADFVPASAAAPAAAAAAASARPASAEAATAERGVSNPLIPGLLLAAGVAGGLLLGGTWWLLRHRG